MLYHARCASALISRIAFILLLMLAIPVLSLSADSMRLKYATELPSSHGQQAIAHDWADEIEQLTGDQIEITVFGAGELIRSGDCYDSVVDGTVDICMSYSSYNPETFVAMNALKLPLGFPNGLTASRAANAFYNKFKPTELNDVRVLYLHASGPSHLHTRQPVRTLSDLENSDIVSAASNTWFVDALGANSTARSVSDVYQDLLKGVADGTLNTMDTLEVYDFAEVTQYTTDCSGIGYTRFFYIVMNKSKWESLSPNIQHVFETTSQKYVDIHGQRWDQADEAGASYAAGLGHEIISLSAAEQAAWANAAQPVINDYIAEANSQGHDGEAYVDMLTDYLGGGVVDNGWRTVRGTITSNGTPVCAMALANGQYMFTCNQGDDFGKYEMRVPLDGNGEITLQSFVSGLAPFRQVLDGSDLTIDIAMQASSPDSQSPAVTTTTATDAATPPGWARITGTVESSGAPLCAMVLANGQYMFSCGASNGVYDLTVPLDGNGQITLYVFVSGKQPYKQTFTP